MTELALIVSKPVARLSPNDAEIVVYEEADDSVKYRVDYVKELIDIRSGILEVEGFNEEELNLILEFLCSSL